MNNDRILFVHINNRAMKNKSSKKNILFFIFITNFLISSCSPEIWMGVAQGLMGIASYGMYNTSSPTSYGSSSYSSYSSSYSNSYSSSESSSPRKCHYCNETGNCKNCKGTGQVYDWGTMSISTKEKYQHRCGVCNGSGKCGVCDGDGLIN